MLFELREQARSAASGTEATDALHARVLEALERARDELAAALETNGLSLEDVAASVIAGVIILIDRPFQVGDPVLFDGAYGEVSAIGLRSVRLVTLDDSVVTIPSNTFLTDAIRSGNWGELEMLIQMDFFVGADQDVPGTRSRRPSPPAATRSSASPGACW